MRSAKGGGSVAANLYRFLACFVLLLLFVVYQYSASATPFKQQQLRGSSNRHSSSTSNSNSNSNKMMRLPSLLYGTAWKKERTASLVELAIRQGFRAIDTACQPKHYFEKGVGDALAKLYEEGVVARSDVFLQTKFTSLDGQDPKQVPYDPKATLEEQVEQSFAKSLENLQTTSLDSLILHSPMSTPEDTLRVWRVFEQIVQRGGTRHIGISNCYDVALLSSLYDSATIKPSFLQNRFYSKSNWDKDIRAYCRDRGIAYQSFWTLTGNPNILHSPLIASLAAKYGKTTEQVWFAFVRSQGIHFLTGTTSEEHMQEDLEAAESIRLTDQEVQQIDETLLVV